MRKHVIYVLKLLLVIGLAYYTYYTLYIKNDLVALWRGIDVKILKQNYYLLVLAFLLVFPNWLLESLKWKKVIDQYSKISLYKSYLSILSGLSVGVITPARTGEYVGRLSLIKKEKRPEAILSTFISSIAQNLVTLVVGLLSYALFCDEQINDLLPQRIWINVSCIVLIITGLYIYFNISVILKRLQRLKIFQEYLLRIQMKDVQFKTLAIVLGFALIRYAIYLVQYVCILKFFGFQSTVWLLLSIIPLIYLLQSLIPLPPLSGLIARGEFALLMLTTIDSNATIILLSALTLWVINLILPALCGMFVMLKFKK